MGAGIMSAIAVVLLFLLTLATNNRVIYERNFSWLVVVNVLVAAILLAVLVWGGVRLLVRLRKGASAAAFCSSSRPSSPGGRGARPFDLRGLLPVCLAFDRNLVRRGGGRGT